MQWPEVIDLIRHTPSPHNVQPWRCRIHDSSRLTLYLDRGRLLPDTDHTGSFMYSAMGMFMEAAAVVAANHDMRVQTQLYPDDDTQTLMPFAELRLLPGADQPSLYPDELLLLRRTSRLAYRPDPVPAAAVERLRGLASAWQQRLIVLSNKRTVADIVGQNIRTLFDDLSDPAYAAELEPWFRYTRRQAQRTRDGLDVRCMALSRAEFLLAGRMPRLLRAPVVRSALQRLYRRRLGPVPAVGVLGGPFWERESAIGAGRFLIRFWLELTQLGLSIHPFGNLITNRRSSAWMRAYLGAEPWWLVFKLGYSAQAPASLRKTRKELLYV